MRHEDSTTMGCSKLKSGGDRLSGWKAKTAARMRALLLALMGLGAFLLPAIGSAQSSDIEVWQETIKQTPPSQPGCFQASYPDMQWQQVFCTRPKNIVPPWRPPARVSSAQSILPAPISGQGYSANAVGGPIWAAEGSFLNVTGVTSIINSLPGQDTQNTYSLQINTDYFKIPGNSSICNSNEGCQGWVQFVYQNTPAWNEGYLAIWYWVLGTNSCPASWEAYGDYSCYLDSGVYTSSQSISNFNTRINISGKTINGQDSIVLTIGGNAYSRSIPSPLNELPQLWQQAQFNVFGEGGGSIAKFNNGSTLIVNTKIDNRTTNAPDSNCSVIRGTGEENNLYFNSPCCRYAGGKPSIAFVEGTEDNSNKFTCDALGNNTITPSVTPSAGGIILPSTPLNVPNGAVSVFTVTPDSGYKISSVSGCGGTLNGNSFTTAPATGNCTVTAVFEVDSSNERTYTVTASATGAGTISPSGSVTVKSRSTKIFRFTPNSGYFVSSVGGTCDGTLSGNTYITKAISSNCTVAAIFSPVLYTVVTSSNDTHLGTINPPVAWVNSGNSQRFTITPITGYDISGVSGTCGGTLNGNIYTTNAITANCNIFVGLVSQTYYTATANAGSGGTISPPKVSVPSGIGWNFRITPNAGYYISSISGCGGQAVSGNRTYTTTYSYSIRPTADCTVTAIFASLTTYTITASADGGGSISPPGTITGVAAGSTRTFTAMPNSDFRLATISGTCGGTRNGNSYTTNAINADCTVAASFTPILPGVEIPGAKIIKAISNSAEMRYAMDGRTDTIWNSGAPPQPTWIDIDLGGNYVVDTVALNPAQLPNGPSTHNIYVKTETGTTWVRIGTIQQYTSDGQWFKQSFPGQNTPVRYVAINTDYAAGSWVAWREIKVSARDQPVTYTVTVNTYTNSTEPSPGSIVRPTSVLVAAGQTASFSITINPGYWLAAGGTSCVNAVGKWDPNNTIGPITTNYTIGPITANCSVRFGFNPMLTASAGPGGTIRPPSGIPVAPTYKLGIGSVFPLTVTPDSGYKISSINSTCGGTSSAPDSNGAVIFNNNPLTGPCTVTATFTKL